MFGVSICAEDRSMKIKSKQDIIKANCIEYEVNSLSILFVPKNIGFMVIDLVYCGTSAKLAMR